MDKSKFTTQPFTQKIEKPWGFELLFSPEDFPVTCKILHVNAGARFSLQYHDQKEEVLTLLSGDALLYLEDENGAVQKIKMVPRQGYAIHKLQKHRCQGVTDCEILDCSTPEVGTTFRLEDDYGRGTETEAIRKTRRKKGVYTG